MFKEKTSLVLWSHLSKFLTDLLDPIIPTTHCKKDSFTFVKK